MEVTKTMIRKIHAFITYLYENSVCFLASPDHQHRPMDKNTLETLKKENKKENEVGWAILSENECMTSHNKPLHGTHKILMSEDD